MGDPMFWQDFAGGESDATWMDAEGVWWGQRNDDPPEWLTDLESAPLRAIFGDILDPAPPNPRRDALMDQAQAALDDPDAERVWWWLSFTDPDRPEGQRFLGVAIVDAPDVLGAWVGRAWELGCNPGGQVAAAGPLSDGVMDENVPETHRRRLLTSRVDLAAVGVDQECIDEAGTSVPDERP